MRKGIFPKLSMGVALAAAVGIFSASGARADLDNTVTYTEPAGTLVMPFDNTTNHVSFQMVTRVVGDVGQVPVATHWSYWAADCRHLIDVFICMTPDDTVVVDPSRLQSEVQTPNPPANVKIGAITDLSGQKGFVTVTAFEADTGPSGLECRVLSPDAVLQNLIFGFWTVANTTTNAATGNDAIGLSSEGGLPDAGLIAEGGIRIQSFNPQSLGDSAVYLVGVEYPAGNGAYAETELGPIDRPIFDGNSVCCNVSYIDNLEIPISLPDLCWKCEADNPISDNVAEEGEVSIIPPTTTVDAPGHLHLTNCEVDDGEGTIVPIGDGANEQFIFGYHGMAVGSYGAAVKAKYTGGPF